ncbi:MAG: DnaD domain protein [Caldilineales bacterium]|nr:DnaD domain protein [Caldilineales bacterium]MDW8316468.1 DnaD domain protein [Anaerolineae bacterium]
MQPFSGFPAGRQAVVKVPNAFFTELLPIVDDLAELKVTLYCLWLLSHKQGDLRYTRLEELAADDRLMAGLAGEDEDGLDALRRGLERAEARGTLLRVKVRHSSGSEDWYFLNSEHGRAAVERIRRGELHTLAEPLPEPITLQAQRPHIYALYEQNIGLIQPMLAEELRDAERTFPQSWIEDAFRIAAELNVRNWKYIRAILERWAAQGKDSGTDQRDLAADDSYEALKRRYLPSGFEDLIEH